MVLRHRWPTKPHRPRGKSSDDDESDPDAEPKSDTGAPAESNACPDADSAAGTPSESDSRPEGGRTWNDPPVTWRCRATRLTYLAHLYAAQRYLSRYDDDTWRLIGHNRIAEVIAAIEQDELGSYA